MANSAPDLPLSVLNERTHLRIPSLPHWIEPTVDYLCRKAIQAGACAEARVGKLMVALHEALSNAVIHGNLGISSALKERDDHAFAEALARQSADPTYANRQVDVVVELDGETCQWTITDQGNGFDVERVLQRCLSDDPEILLASGRGILMMRSFLDEVRYQQGGRQLVLTLRRYPLLERRLDSRRPLHAPIRVAPIRADGSVDWAAAQEAVSRNISEHGINVLHHKLETAGQVLIGMVNGSEVIYVPAEVRHCRSLAEGNVELGCRFLTDTAGPAFEAASSENAGAIQSAIDRLLGGDLTPEVQRRAHARVQFSERVDLLLPGKDEVVVGFARDISRGGVALITRMAPPEEFTIAFVSHIPPLHLRARVVRCDRIMEGFYDVGARFLGVSGANT